MMIPKNYEERVYAGVLGKVIGVYLGRPFEGWSHAAIMQELGEIDYYVHERLGKPLIVTDDDITGTFTFLRALEDAEDPKAITAQAIGKAWLNYLIENRTILWWGGLGMSTEHTAYLRLKQGYPAPQSGSRQLNGKVVSEQIGAQIFIDGWAMVAPGDARLAADLAHEAASVSHDGAAIHGAQVIAVMEAMAFVEPDMQKLIDLALAEIPEDSVIRRLIDDVRNWHATIEDWREARKRLEEHYGYHIYGGNCHMVPNHGLIILSLLYGEDDFQKSMRIVNTCGWDTDCNAANVGCILGIKNGLAGLEEGPDWRGPVADRVYLPTADGGRAISDALTESYRIINLGRRLKNQKKLLPKNGARFHFDLPGAVQGFQVENSIECRGTGQVRNVACGSRHGRRSLAIEYHGVAHARSCRVATPTFIPKEAIDMQNYDLIASPTLYAGQTVRASMLADSSDLGAVQVGLFLRHYGPDDELVILRGPEETLRPGNSADLVWQIPDLQGYPIAEIGLEIRSKARRQGTIFLDWLTWDGQPQGVLSPAPKGHLWTKSWVNAVDDLQITDEPFRLIQNEGMGLISQGTDDFIDYRATTTVIPHLCRKTGLGVRVCGMRRYYALLLSEGGVLSLVRCEDESQVLAHQEFDWQYGQSYTLCLEVSKDRLRAWANGRKCFEAYDEKPLPPGGVALLCHEGRVAFDQVRIEKAQGTP